MVAISAPISAPSMDISVSSLSFFFLSLFSAASQALSFFKKTVVRAGRRPPFGQRMAPTPLIFDDWSDMVPNI